METDKETDKDMPRTDSPKMVEIKFAVPEALLADAIDLAKSEGWKIAELHRIFWERGFASYAQGSNERRVNREFRRQEEVREGQGE